MTNCDFLVRPHKSVLLALKRRCKFHGMSAMYRTPIIMPFCSKVIAEETD